MNISQNPALLEQLAASHALGTLRGGARRRFEALARQDPSIRAVALVWQGRMGSLVELQADSVPSPAVWTRIDNLIKAEKESVAMRVAREQPIKRQAGGLWASLGLWRGAAGAGALAAVLAVVVGSDLNGRLNEQLRGERGQVAQLSARLAATPEIQYVAVLADDKAKPSMLVTFDPKNNRLVLKRVGEYQEQADRSLELWALPPGRSPQSLGVLGREPVIRLASTGNAVRDTPAMAITLEPVGGAPAGGGPTGPILFSGAVIETVR